MGVEGAHRRATRRCVLGLWFIATTFTASLSACSSRGNASEPGPRPDLAGNWVRNAGESETPAERLMRGRDGGSPPEGSRGGGGAGRGGMRPGGGMGGARGGGPEMQERMERARTTIQMLTEEGSSITVNQSDSTVVLTYANGSSFEIVTDGKEREKAITGLGDVKVKAEWKDGQLVIERKLEDGLKVREEYTRGPDSPRLLVVTSVSGLPRDLTFRSVYDRRDDG